MPGDGDLGALYAFVGEGPGKHEVAAKRGFVGPSGELLWPCALRYAGLTREQVYVTNFSKLRLNDDLDIKMSDEDFNFWCEQLREELDIWFGIGGGETRYIAAIGAYAATALSPHFHSMEVHHGMAFQHGNMAVMPVYHPAAALRPEQGHRLAYTAHDLGQFGRLIRGEAVEWHKHDTLPVQYHEGWVPSLDLRPAFISIDTEGGATRPWCMTWSTTPSSAGLIRATDQAGLRAFLEWLSAVRPVVILHYALADIDVLRAMGIDLVALGLTIHDTGDLAHLRQLDPHGLKPLATRHHGVAMQDYEDIVLPAYVTAMEQELDSIIQQSRIIEITKRGTKVTLSPVGKRAQFMKGVGERGRKKGQTVPERAKYLRENMPGGEQPNLDYVDPDVARVYACRDADVTGRLYPTLLRYAKDEGLLPSFELDMAVLPMFERMQQNGLHWDRDRHAQLSADVDRMLDEATIIAQAYAQDLPGFSDFNPNSSDQVAKWCEAAYATWGTCKLKRLTKSKTRESSDDAALSAIVADHLLIPQIQYCRELKKLKCSYLDKIPAMVVGDTLYPDWKLWSVVSGRAASWILTFPARTELGRRVRSLFTARPGMQMLSVDYSQIELRKAAQLANDHGMIEAFKRGEDIHTRMAATVFRVTYDKVDKLTQRYPSKTVTFLVMYGGSALKLYEQLVAAGVKRPDGTPVFSLQECQALIDAWFGAYPAILGCIQEVSRKGRQFGYVTSTLGRRRYLPALALPGRHWPCSKLREEAERQAFNMCIQTDAQDDLKMGMRTLWRETLPELRSNGIVVEPLLQYHDELVFEIPEGTADIVYPVVAEAMTRHTRGYPVPIEVEGKTALDWGGLK